ncbi:sensor histidine kinase [Kiloniella sp.]|uniref:sensor histidine kinase n=1 Tax=Kiloniella sp. TaxID=1938587 RepID=UPI003B02553C
MSISPNTKGLSDHPENITDNPSDDLADKLEGNPPENPRENQRENSDVNSENGLTDHKASVTADFTKNPTRQQRRLDLKVARQYITRPIILIFCVLAACLGTIYFSWSSLQDIEKALPITIAKQQRDIAILVQDVSDLAWQAKLTNSKPTPEHIQEILDQVAKIESHLTLMRNTYNFDNLVGASAMHAVITPALADIKHWLTNGVYNLPASSQVVITLVDTRATDAINTMRPMFAMTQQKTFSTLSHQSSQILTFRNSIVFFLVGMFLVTVVVIFQMYRLKKIDQDLFEAREAALKASRAKSEFLATMSHEFRTPLNAILGFSEMMQEQFFGPLGTNTLGSEKYAKYTNDIHHSGKHLLSLVNDVLDIAAIESGKLPLHRKQLDTLDILEDSFKSLGKRARDNNVELLMDVPKGIPALYADKRAITQIMLNLLSNAIKFTEPNGLVKVFASSDNKCIKITVVDTGVGIPPDRLPTITDAFTQAESNPHRTQEGTGLGLSIAKALIEAHKGTLSIRSQVGKGTEVSVLLPCWGTASS